MPNTQHWMAWAINKSRELSSVDVQNVPNNQGLCSRCQQEVQNKQQEYDDDEPLLPLVINFNETGQKTEWEIPPMPPML